MLFRLSSNSAAVIPLRRLAAQIDSVKFIHPLVARKLQHQLSGGCRAEREGQRAVPGTAKLHREGKS